MAGEDAGGDDSSRRTTAARSSCSAESKDRAGCPAIIRRVSTARLESAPRVPVPWSTSRRPCPGIRTASRRERDQSPGRRDSGTTDLSITPSARRTADLAPVPRYAIRSERACRLSAQIAGERQATEAIRTAHLRQRPDRLVTRQIDGSGRVSKGRRRPTMRAGRWSSRVPKVRGRRRRPGHRVPRFPEWLGPVARGH